MSTDESLPAHPMQPLVKVGHVVRFRPNEVVRYLLDNGKLTLNDLARQGFSDEDRMQFAQLIGYSVSGYGDLSYVSDESYDAAAAGVTELLERDL